MRLQSKVRPLRKRQLNNQLKLKAMKARKKKLLKEEEEVAEETTVKVKRKDTMMIRERDREATSTVTERSTTDTMTTEATRSPTTTKRRDHKSMWKARKISQN